MPPLVSVVMPCFNAGPMLRPALVSVLEQTHPDVELIFVDNNSTDGSADLARQVLTGAGRDFTVTACAEPGANHARNHGYALARGDYIQWMDADDRLDRDKIALQVAALEARPGDGIAYGDWSVHRIEPGGAETGGRTRLRQIDDQVQRTLAGIWYPPHLYLLRRSAADLLRQEQGWWPERTVGTDFEYFALAALLGLRFRHVPGAHVRYNVWSAGQTSTATPYAARVASLRAIFERLRQFVASGRARVALSARHRVLLDVDWDVWRLPRSSTELVRLPGRRFALRRRADGRQIELRPREASIVQQMLRASAATAPLHHALGIASLAPELADEHVVIAQTIERLRREGFLERVAPQAASGGFGAELPAPAAPHG